jgi:DNA-binding PadR family transcriptional regulator
MADGRRVAQPLTRLSLSILLAMADEDRHGYGIMKEIERLTEGELQVGAGSLYGALQRLTAEGLVEESPQDAGAGEDARRRYYRLTASGRAAARAEIRRMARTIDVACEKRLVRGLGTSFVLGDA